MNDPWSATDRAPVNTHATSLLRAIMDALPIGICLVDPQGLAVSLNREGERLLDRTESGCVGRPLHDLIGCRLDETPDDNTPSDAAFDPNRSWSAQAKDTVVGAGACPIRRTLDTGLPSWSPRSIIYGRLAKAQDVEYTCAPLNGPEFAGALFTFRDRSAQTKTEQDLHRLATIPEESPMPIVEFDSDGHFLYANQTMTRLLKRFGYTAAGYPAILPAELPDIIRRAGDAAACLTPTEVTLDGVCFSWTFCYMPFCQLVRAYGTELTAVHAFEQRLKAVMAEVVDKNVALDLALRRAEEAVKTKSRFLATMSHEIRTPLNGVIGMLELLGETPLTQDQHDCTTLAKQSAATLLHTLDDVLDFTKIEVGKLLIEQIPFDLRALVEETLTLVAEPAAKKGIDLVSFVDPRVPGILLGDRHRLRQILTNLIGNAIKFTSAGDIVIRVETQPASEPGVDGTVSLPLRLSVSDTGIGIPASRQSQLFQPFTQADSSTTRQFGGTGLGLAICKQLVELMGGTIGVESKAGEGSTFWFTLTLNIQPVQPDKPADPVQPAPAPLLPELAQRRTLIVAGSETLRAALRTLLAEFGMGDVCEDDGPHTLMLLRATARSRPFDLVILDQRLPGLAGTPFATLDGAALANAIASDPALAATQVVLMAPVGATASRHQGQAESASAAPRALPHLTKPFRREALRHLVTTLWTGPSSRPAVPAISSPCPAPAASPEPCPSRTDVERTGRASRGRILLVEDNEINQVVAHKLLEKLGYTVDIAKNGQEALDLALNGTYGAVLMDCQMPIMDGFKATQKIREREASRNVSGSMFQGSGSQSDGFDHQPQTCNVKLETQNRIPIIAMTANSYASDRDQCLASGMDDFLPKPVLLKTLEATLTRWLQRDPRPPTAAASFETSAPPKAPAHPDSAPPAHQTIQPFDLAAALARVGGDRHLLHEMAGLFATHSPLSLTNLRAALDRRDADLVRQICHTLKGMLSNFFAQPALEAVARVRTAFSAGDHTAIDAAYRTLRSETIRLTDALAGIAPEDPSCAS